MNVQFNLLIEIDPNLEKSNDEDNRHYYADHSILHKLSALSGAFNFGQMPFDKCIVCEGHDDLITCGDEIFTNEVCSRLKDWITCILDVVRGEICNRHQDGGIVEFGFTDDKLTYGFCLNVRLEGSSEIFHFKVMPKTTDAFNMTTPPQIEQITLKGDYQK